MSELTPSEARKREKRIERFGKSWFINPLTFEIRHRESNLFQKIIELFWRKKYKVFDLYWWAVRKWGGEEMITFPDAIKQDDISIKGFPRKYQLVNGWSIPKEDIKYLDGGPLADEIGNVIVKYQSVLQKYVSVVSQLKPLSWIVGCLLMCIRYRVEIKMIFNHIK